MAHIVIIGSSIAGQSTAFNLRETDRETEITLISEESCPLYDRRLIPQFLAGRLQEQDLFLCSDDFYRSRKITVLADQRVTGVKLEKKALALRKGGSLAYDSLVIASGQRPSPPEIHGARKPGVGQLWDLSDARQLRSRIITEPICLVGAVPDALETARVLAERFRQEVKLVTDSPATPLTLSSSVEYIAGALQEIIGEGQVQAVRLTGGKVIGVGTVVFMEAGGSLDFLKGTGLLIEDGALVVDEKQRTNIPGVYACGMAASCGGQKATQKTWESCAEEGRVLASTLISERPSICQNS